MTAADDERFRDAYLEGRREWPDIDVAFEQFSLHCERVCADEPVRFAADLYFACACACRDQDATRILLTDRLPGVTKAISRLQADPDFVTETLQVVQHRLLVGAKPKIAEYSGRGPLAAWLAVVATRTALDELRGRRVRAGRQLDLPEQLAQSTMEPEVRIAKAEYLPVFQEALRDAVARLQPRARNVLRMHVAGCTVDQIGKAYGVHRATAARWVVGARGEVFEFVRGQLTREQARLSPREFDSVAKLVQSQLDLSFLDGGTLAPTSKEEPAEHASNG